MACFIAPTSVAIITTALRKKFPKNWHINWLNTMIWGGAVGLAIEHIAHQEIVPWPPFLTAMGNPADTVVMLKEMASVGVPMTFALVFAWAVIVNVYENFIVTNRSSISARTTSK
ncbi:hypothetical protein JW930_01115 [Candidatus Woesearchaeota archaeon]|nr:hypothetical protein [Candidatus Woesearchaeota archaeon]